MPSDQLEHQGWHITCTTSSISKEGALDALKARLGPGVFSLPEQLFGDNALVLRHAATGLALRFGALGALLAWRADARPPVKVGVAAAWRSAHAAQLRESGAVELDYDWTYSTSYGGDVEVEPPVTHPGSIAAVDRKQGSGEVRWEASGAPLNRAPLLRRDPILFYADVPLYTSELDDNGASQLSVKVRVMPRCWLVLLRFWLRVDGVLVRLRETRYLAELLGPAPGPSAPAASPHAAARPLSDENSPSEQPGPRAGFEGQSSQDSGELVAGGAGPAWRLTREVKCSEGTFEELQAHGAPGSGPSYADADSTALALQAVAPVGVSEFRTEVCRLDKEVLKVLTGRVEGGRSIRGTCLESRHLRCSGFRLASDGRREEEGLEAERLMMASLLPPAVAEQSASVLLAGAVLGAAPLAVLAQRLMQRESKPPGPFLARDEFKELALAAKEQEAQGIWRVSFNLPHKAQLLGLPGGQQVVARFTGADGRTHTRRFFPINTDAEPGVLVLLVKPKGTCEASAALFDLPLGSKVAFQGPVGSFKYEPFKYKNIGMLAGGLGVTAMIRMAHDILANPADKVKLRLVVAANCLEAVALKRHLDALAAGYYGKFKVWYVVNAAPDFGQHVSMGLIDQQMIAKYLNMPPSPEVLVLRCGPPAFNADMAAHLTELGYTPEHQVELVERERPDQRGGAQRSLTNGLH